MKLKLSDQESVKGPKVTQMNKKVLTLEDVDGLETPAFKDLKREDIAIEVPPSEANK